MVGEESEGCPVVRKSPFLRYFFLSIIFFSFFLNLLWENLQASLYAGYRSFAQHFWLCFRATIGDIVIILFLYFLMSLCRKDMYWIRKIQALDVVVLLVVGLVLGVANELLALEFGRWWYTAAMPLLPWYHVGLWPVLQLLVLPLLTFYLVKKTIYN